MSKELRSKFFMIKFADPDIADLLFSAILQIESLQNEVERLQLKERKDYELAQKRN